MLSLGAGVTGALRWWESLDGDFVSRDNGFAWSDRIRAFEPLKPLYTAARYKAVEHFPDKMTRRLNWIMFPLEAFYIMRCPKHIHLPLCWVVVAAKRAPVFP